MIAAPRDSLILLFMEGHLGFYIEAIFSLISVPRDSLILSCGYQTSHILPVLDGRIVSQCCRRINIGGCHIDGYMQRLLQLKYPGHLAAVTLSRAEVNKYYPIQYPNPFAAELLASIFHSFF